MLLSFERPARRRLLAGPGPGLLSGEFCLFADLENCTVANDTGITGQSRKALPKITVKIVRAHGGCLGTKSRRRA
jgi:hypothetical protein